MKRSTTVTLVIAKTTLGASLALGLMLSPHSTAHAYAAPVETINLTDVQDIDSLPICIEEDCSDQVGQTGVWLNRAGDWYLERGEDYTRRIIDNTVTGGAYLGPDTVGSDPYDDHIIATGPNAWDAGAYVGGWN